MNNLDLISSIYAATLSPHRFHETAADLEAQVIEFVRGATGISDFGDVLPESRGGDQFPGLRDQLARHVETALAIQSRLQSEAQDSNARMEALVGMISSPAAIVDADETVIRANRLWASRGPQAADTLAGRFASPQTLELVRRALAAVRQGAGFVAQPLQFDPQGRQSACILVKRLATAEAGLPEGALFLLTIVDFGFPDEVVATFRATYRLTEAETGVALALAGGEQPAQIARARSVSLDTVRAQIKSVKHKTGVRDIPDLVRLLCGFCAGVLVPEGFLVAEAKPVQAPSSPAFRSIRLADGRRMEYVAQGAAAGEPVILFHNMPYGQVLPAAAIRYAARTGITVYSPYRPGCRGSDPIAGLRREDWLDTVCRDTVEFMDRLGVASAPFIGNVAGSTFAVRMATLHPERVRGIVMVSRAPIWKKEWLAQLPANHRLLSMLLWLMPSFAEMFVRSIGSYMKRHSAEAYLRSAVLGSSVDLAALDDPEILRLLSTGVLEGLAQGGETFCKDWEAMQIDLAAETAGLPHPIHIVHGAQDRVVNPEFSREFARQVRTAKLELVEGAGHLAFYTHWRTVLEAVAAVAPQRQLAEAQ